MLLSANRDYFLEERQQTDVCNGEGLFFLRCGLN
jgi:hypothetical protein